MHHVSRNDEIQLVIGVAVGSQDCRISKAVHSLVKCKLGKRSSGSHLKHSEKQETYASRCCRFESQQGCIQIFNVEKMFRHLDTENVGVFVSKMGIIVLCP